MTDGSGASARSGAAVREGRWDPARGAQRHRRTASVWGHDDVALVLARAKYPGLSDEDHIDIVQEAMTNVLVGCAAGRSRASAPTCCASSARAAPTCCASA
jgi:hypothetical protein